jgi:hypothetical protein
MFDEDLLDLSCSNIPLYERDNSVLVYSDKCAVQVFDLCERFRVNSGSVEDPAVRWGDLKKQKRESVSKLLAYLESFHRPT